MDRRKQVKYKILTEKPVAYDSLDHIVPEGTSRDNHTSAGYISEVINYFDKKKINYLDLGCSGGQLVIDFMNLGNGAVGIEGSDYSAKLGRANWADYYNKNLFTADVSHPFKVVDEEGEMVKFDCISAWEVLEHIPLAGLKTMMQNIYDHLTPNGIFVGSVSLDPNPQWHVSVFPKEFWQKSIFSPLFIMEEYPFVNVVREDVRHCSFFVLLRKA
jgi:2-polyprenyl-3-methyl-5-hydroxy-6-metoxy-1,4-benzoquinol methylase